MPFLVTPCVLHSTRYRELKYLHSFESVFRPRKKLELSRGSPENSLNIVLSVHYKSNMYLLHFKYMKGKCFRRSRDKCVNRVLRSIRFSKQRNGKEVCEEGTGKKEQTESY
jgi:hypothetical protein